MEKPVLKSVLIAASNPKHGSSLAGLMTENFGAAATTIVNDGEAAWNAANAEEFSFVIVDWKLEKISGLILFNRLRMHEKYRSKPILVMSELVQKENFVLLKDYPLTGLADGAFAIPTLQVKIDILMGELTWFEKNTAALKEILVKMKGNAGAAKAEMEKLAQSSPNKISILNLAGKRFRELECYKEAEELLNEARKIDASNTTTILELSKIYHYTDRPKKALDLMKISKFSMKNVERLLLVGELNLADKNPEEARKVFQSALNVDAENETAQAGIVVADNMEEFLGKNDPSTLPQHFASALNLVALTMVNSGKQEEGINHYKCALAFAHDSVSQAKVMFNLGLGFLKWQKKNEAYDWFEKSAKRGGAKFSKANEHLKTLQAEGFGKATPGKTPEKNAPKQAAVGQFAPAESNKPAAKPPPKKAG